MTDLECLPLVGLVARRSLCLKAHCGALVVSGDTVIGEGYNGPPLDDLAHRRCSSVVPSKKKPRSDRTCCVHAEWRAIVDALTTSSRQVKGATLYFARVDSAGTITASRRPYCTVCSRLALDVGIADWVLWHGPLGGIQRYAAAEYNRLSHLYDDPEPV